MLLQPRNRPSLENRSRRWLTCCCLITLSLLSSACLPRLSAQQPPAQENPPAVSSSTLRRCQIVPLADHQASFQIDGIEKLRWHFGENYPRPFFFPFNGPSGTSLTRMGHPGAPNHDHHQSVWFAHNKVNGLDFWGNGHGTKIRQKQWCVYRDGDEEAVMAVLLGWFAPDGTEVMEQELIAALIPLPADEHALEIQVSLRPASQTQEVTLEQTNFGFLAVRVAQSISAVFGAGQLTNSESQVGEKAVFAQPARWMDYSGPVAVGTGPDRISQLEGITFFDHPQNPRYPTHWHVRQDGWMGASYGMQASRTLTAESPLTLRYLLHAHSGAYDPQRAEEVQQQFTARPGFELSPSQQAHHQFQVQRRP